MNLGAAVCRAVYRLGEVSSAGLAVEDLIDEGRHPPIQTGLAAGIPGARFVPLDSPNHIIFEDEPAFPRLLAKIRGFLAT